jgi:multiple sugar transport system substrate-binding protein
VNCNPVRHRQWLLWLVALLSLWAVPASAAELRVVMMAVSGQQRSILIETMAEFGRRHPDVTIRFDQLEHESYKDQFESLARSGRYDVMFWFGGERLTAAVQQGLVQPLSKVPGSAEWRREFPAGLIAATTVDQEQYALPLSYYGWGVYYSKPLFERLGLKPPADWEGLIDTAEALQRTGITPFALGSRFPWTLAGWFDYLNMRMNGIDHHLGQLRGQIPFDSPETRRVFVLWADLLQRGWFQSDHADSDWRAVVPGLLRGQTGMLLMGNFMLTQVPAAQRGNIGFFAFPDMNSDVPRGEDAPTDVMLVPVAARNLREAGLLLSFLAEPEIQTQFNAGVGLLPPRLGAAIPDDPLLRASAETVANAVTAAQFFDRDALPAIRDAGLAAFQAFVSNPADIEGPIRMLEAARPQNSQAGVR